MTAATELARTRAAPRVSWVRRLWLRIRRWFGGGEDDGSTQAAAVLARDVVAALRRVLATARLYSVEHPVFEEHLGTLMTQLSRRLATHGDLTLHVEPGRLVTHGDDDPRETPPDPLFEMLFADGIASITFHTAVNATSIRRYVTLWHTSSTSSDDPEHSFASRAWEADLPGITTRLRFSFGEFSGTAADELRRHYQQLMDTIRNVAAERGGGDTGERLDAYVGERESSGGSATTTQALAEPELNGLSAAVTSSTRGAGQRVLTRLWYEFRTSEGGEELVHLAASVVDGLAQAGRTAELVRAFTRITTSARGDATAEARLQLFLVALGNQKVVTTLAAQLDNAEARAGAAFLLSELPAVFTEHIVTACRAASPEARAQLAGFIARKELHPHQLALWMLALEPDLAELLLEVSAAMSPHHLDAAIRIALLADAGSLRRSALARIDPQAAERYRSLIEANGDHPDGAVRLASLTLLLGVADRHATTVYAKQLAADDASLAIANVCARGLADIGGTTALSALCSGARRGRPRALRVLVVQLLSQFPEDEAERVLRQTAQRWFEDREVRTAARLSLRRRELRRSA